VQVRILVKQPAVDNPFSYWVNRAVTAGWSGHIWDAIRAARREYGFRELEEIKIIYGRGSTVKNAGKRRSDMFFMLRPGERDDRPDEILVEVSLKSTKFSNVFTVPTA